MDPEKIKVAATALADATDSDVFLYNGEIERPFDNQLINICEKLNRRKNAYLFLCSHGGNPDAAYRMARSIQNNYSRFLLVINGTCKSSGTLIALGAHELVMTANAELGPLDIQLGKKDELWETDSGLTVLNAISELETKAYELFENGFVKLKVTSSGRITLKTATSLANELALGIITPIMSQIDPLHVGEVSRAMKIGKEYGERLSKVSQNLKPGTLDSLINSYPSHGFVIDRKEASDLFQNVRDANAKEQELIELLGTALRTSHQGPVLITISNPKAGAINEDNHQEVAGDSATSAGAGNGQGAGDGQSSVEHAPDNVTELKPASADPKAAAKG